MTQDEVAALRERLETGPAKPTDRSLGAEREWAQIRPVIKHFGITRVGDVTGLDRIGVPVVQAFRPAAKSNVVNQGKGLSMAQAALSAVMEALETWAAERLPRDEMRRGTARQLLTAAQREALASTLTSDHAADWADTVYDWVPGWDLVNGEVALLPAAIVATDYTLASPFRDTPFPRSTTGLGAGANAWDAVRQGLAEIVERDATAKAFGIHGFFDRCRVSTSSVERETLAALIAKVQAAGLLIGFWTCPAPDGWAVIWAKVLEEADSPDQLPLPADGFGASPCMQAAAEKALLEAVQTRASVIAGGREDLTRRAYPRFPKRDLIEAERRLLLARTGTSFTAECEATPQLSLGTVRDGSPRPITVVPLFDRADPVIHIVRVVVPGFMVAAE